MPQGIGYAPDFMNQFGGMGMGGGGAPLPPQSPAPQGGNPFASALGGGQAPAAAGGVRPYNALMDPSQDGLFGFLGRMSGAPTRDEYNKQVIGNSRAKGLQKLQALIDTGASPQKALLQFVQTPEGQDMLIHDFDGLQQATAFLASSQETPTKLEKWSPGDIIGNPMTGEVVTRIPGQDEIDRMALYELAQLSPEEQQELAEAEARRKATGDATASEQALTRLVQDGQINQTTADKLLGGVLVQIPQRDADGNLIGYSLYDYSTNKTENVMGNAPTELEQPEKVEGPGGSLQAVIDAITPEERAAGASAADIVDGAGPYGALSESLGGFFGNFNPNLAGERWKRYRTALRIIQNDAQNIRGAQTDGRSFALDAGLIQNVTDLTNNSSGMNPLHAANTLIQWHDYLQQSLVEATETRQDPNTSKQVRASAAEAIVAIASAMKSLPSRQELEAKLATLRSEEGGIIGRQLSDTEQAVEETVDSAGNLLSGVEEVLPQTAPAPQGPATPLPHPQSRPSAAVPSVQPAAQPAPKAGEVLDGYQFLGGDPSIPESWRRVYSTGLTAEDPRPRGPSRGGPR